MEGGGNRVEQLWSSASARIAAHGIDVHRRTLPPDIPAEFDGLSIVVNPVHDFEPLCWYLVHSFGSIAGWCLDLDGVKRMFHDLRDAKARKGDDPEGLEHAIERFRTFEELASCYSVWLLGNLGHEWAVRPFTVFFRADLEAMTIFHREGRAPVWRTFLPNFTRDVERGARAAEPFTPVEIPPFQPARFERQQVKQETGSAG